MIVVLILAAGAGWEPEALAVIEAHPGLVALRRCVDVDDLLAAASSGQAEAAVLAVDAPGLDPLAVDQLRHHGVRPVGVVPAGLGEDPARLRALRAGLSQLLAEDELDALPAVLAEPTPAGRTDGPVGDGPLGDGPDDGPVDHRAGRAGPAGAMARPGRVITVWGPAGAPGRTTVAAGVAAELARRGETALLLDADPYGGAIAQQLGVLDEVSGLLQAARLQSSGELAHRVVTAVRSIGPGLGVVTGLPRPDRWSEIRIGLVEQLVAVARRHGHVVIDTGFSLEEEPAADLTGRAGRNQLSIEAVQAADQLVVVGGADPVGLTRLARALADLRERGTTPAAHVVVNRMRPTLGWTEQDITGMILAITRPAGCDFLPEDRGAVDRALVAGRTLLETAPDSALTRAIAALVDGLAGGAAEEPREVGAAAAAAA
ncbi:MAG: hypothetical protein QM638_17735, partial [Nocardioides sp.]|uniref:AAA family ATPase n=1 Tax=Nocardioides sp. TaxID=35761 RepID=UPI0039E3DA29